MPVTFEDVRKIALSMENVSEATSYGTAAFKNDGKLMARLRDDGDSLVVATTFEEREELLAIQPEVYYITDHYLKYPWVLVRLSKVHPGAIRDLLIQAWKLSQPKRKPSRRS